MLLLSTERGQGRFAIDVEVDIAVRGRKGGQYSL